MIDVCLLLEGTYPYVAGGVSTWVHQLVSAMKNIKFGIVYIAPFSDPTRRMKYTLPPQVLSLKEVYLHDYDRINRRKRRAQREDFELLRFFYEQAFSGHFDRLSDFFSLFRGPSSCLDLETVFGSREIWDILTYFYRKGGLEISFLDFFWTWRGTHLPIYQILTADIPPAKVYHSVSTGYAGLLGAIARSTMGGKFFLTEHGIYTHERLLEISQATWIYEEQKRSLKASRGMTFFKAWWGKLFELLSSIAYQEADQILTLFQGNKTRQILFGAPPEKVHVIPNGIDLASFEEIKREKKPNPQIGLIGRVVSIKDIKTFIQSARLVLNRIPHAQFYVAGPTDEEEDYFEECKLLAETLHLESHLVFTGRVNPRDYYSFLDLVVLTSLSEAQPYVILEANIVGIPLVATDVGACREMLEGTTLEDRNLGASGLITQVSNPEETAQAIIRLIHDKPLYENMARAGQTRVKRFYDQDDLLSRYMNLYEQNL